MLQKYHADDSPNFVQYINHRMQIMQERWEYDLMTNSVQSIQHIFVTSKFNTVRWQ